MAQAEPQGKGKGGNGACCNPEAKGAQNRHGKGKGGSSSATKGNGQGGPKYQNSVMRLASGRDDMTIASKGKDIVIEQADGHSYSVVADGEGHAIVSPMGSVNVSAKWDDGTLEVVTTVRPLHHPEPGVFKSVYDPAGKKI